VAQALPVAAQQVQAGVPLQQAAQGAAAEVIVKNAVPVAVQLIKTGTPASLAITQAINGNIHGKVYNVYFTWAPGVTEQRKTEILKAEGLTPSGAGFGALLSFTTLSAESPQILWGRLTSRSYGEMKNVNVTEGVKAC
jgi:hypothetical protein